MNSETESEKDLDELVSSVLDGEATSAEESQVRNNAELSERLHRFSQVAGVVSAPVDSLDEISSRRMLDDALAQVEVRNFTTPTGKHATDAPAPSRLWRWVSAAAVLTLIAISVPLLRSVSSNDNPDLVATSSRDASSSDEVRSLVDADLADEDTNNNSALDGSTEAHSEGFTVPEAQLQWLGDFSSETMLAAAAMKALAGSFDLAGAIPNPNGSAVSSSPDTAGVAPNHSQEQRDWPTQQAWSNQCGPIEMPEDQLVEAEYQGATNGRSYDVIISSDPTDTLRVYLRPWSHCRLIEIVL